jgi:hypothetical protein
MFVNDNWNAYNCRGVHVQLNMWSLNMSLLSFMHVNYVYSIKIDCIPIGGNGVDSIYNLTVLMHAEILTQVTNVELEQNLKMKV